MKQAHQALDEVHLALVNERAASEDAHAVCVRIEATLKASESSLDEAFAQINVLEGKCSDLEKATHVAQGQLYDVFQSTSWKVTTPIRSILRIKQRISGGIFAAISRTINSILGKCDWPNGPPIVTQGFSGERIVKPGPNPDEPLISVVMPVYNACRVNKQFLIQALKSIVNQTYKQVELIIVNDGSTDETQQVCQEFLATHPKLRAQYLSKTNGGQSSARNVGIGASHGEYVGFIDQDDEWYESKLEEVVPWLANREIDVLYTDSDSIDGDGNLTHERIHGKHHCGWPHPKKSPDDVAFKDIFVMPGLMTIKKTALEIVGGFDENLSGYEDDDLYFRLYQRFKFFYLPIPTLRWRIYGDNYSFSHRMLKSRTLYWQKLIACYHQDRYRVKRISLRFFWSFMGQAKMQFQKGHTLCWDSFDGAKNIWPHLPWLQRALFAPIFILPSRRILPLLCKVREKI